MILSIGLLHVCGAHAVFTRSDMRATRELLTEERAIIAKKSNQGMRATRTAFLEATIKDLIKAEDEAYKVSDLAGREVRELRIECQEGLKMLVEDTQYQLAEVGCASQ